MMIFELKNISSLGIFSRVFSIALTLGMFFVLASQASKPQREVKLKREVIEGTIRRPEIEWIQPKAKVRQLAPKLYQRKFQDLEVQIIERARAQGVEGNR